ncbi:MAG: allantoinase AllB, partial [Thermoanaerobaculia bacterium]
MSASEFVLSSRRVATPEGVGPASIHVRGGRIASVTRGASPPASVPVVELNDLAVLPGLVDSHVHVNEPGRA